MYTAIVLIVSFYLSITGVDCASLNPNLALLTPGEKAVNGENGTPVDTNKPSSYDALPKAALPSTSENVNSIPVLNEAGNDVAADTEDDSQKVDSSPKTAPNTEEDNNTVALEITNELHNDNLTIQNAGKIENNPTDEKSPISQVPDTKEAEKLQPSNMANKEKKGSSPASSSEVEGGLVENADNNEPQSSSPSVDKDQGNTATKESISKDVGDGADNRPGQEHSIDTNITARDENETDGNLTAYADAAHSNNDGHENVPESGTSTLVDASYPKKVENTNLPSTDKTEDAKNLEDTSDKGTGADESNSLTEEGKVPDDEHHADMETASKEHVDSSGKLGFLKWLKIVPDMAIYIIYVVFRCRWSGCRFRS